MTVSDSRLATALLAVQALNGRQSGEVEIDKDVLAELFTRGLLTVGLTKKGADFLAARMVKS